MFWWERNNLRMIQTNLREVDATLNVNQLISDLKAFSANTLMMNAGGIFAFYPTKLKYQYQTPYLKQDLLREVIEKTHEAGMRFIARFDFSKAHESIFKEKPEWFYRTIEGHEVNYNGIVHTCINGYYQQTYSLEMIKEVITEYKVDGIFFNMFGYQTSDYSSHDYGICHCQSCQTRFRKMYQLELPESNDRSNERYKKYKEFQWRTTQEMLDRIHDLVKKINPHIAISTYNDYKVDIVRKESNTKLTRPHPVWLYSSSENVKSVEDTWDDKLISNCCINAVDLQYRFHGVSEQEVSIRLYESIASGSGLDFCIIGVFDRYSDQKNFPTVKDIFRFHEENEQYYGQLLSVEEIALIKPTGPQVSNETEYLGIFKMLKEEHKPFDVVCQHQLVTNEEKLKRFQFIIIPDIREWEGEQLNTLIRLHQQGVKVVATGQTLTQADQAQVLRSLFNGEFIKTTTENDAAYLLTKGKQLSSQDTEQNWVFIDGEFSMIKFSNCDKWLPYILPSTFGPPERAYNHKLSEFHGAGIAHTEYGANAYLTWQPGTLYYQHGYEDHKQLFDRILNQLEYRSILKADAPGSVEMFINRTAKGQYVVQLLNLSGFNGVTYMEPIPIGPIQIELHLEDVPTNIIHLNSKKAIAFEADSSHSTITFQVDQLQRYDAYVIEMR
ncbi:family 10 glycosylhydrolase [Shouchella clausii]|uniref:family 10 glycosylhydrolase n=1 Tax=Shouchella clausii TaxID=79880 RepID=UPI000D1E7C9A|nr:family 10 glycosylhydrolase [Shouchella clausii]MCY1103719.1 family 10 glycosylhydrolase [Shouchella clausii]PTL23000.1 hypothetical protein DA802_09955 [Shouchella clausii]